MNKLLLSVLLSTGLFIPSARALTFTIDIATAETFAFDIVWGATPFAPLTIISDWGGGGNLFIGDDLNTAVHLQEFTSPPRFPTSSDIRFDFPTVGAIPDRHFTPPEIHGTLPASVTATADGFGAHFVYGTLPGGDEVPDGAATEALLGLALAGCLFLKRSQVN